MALYQNGILISGANTLPQMTLAEYQALPVSERPTYWERTDLDYSNIPASGVAYDNTQSGLTATNVQDAIDAVNDNFAASYVQVTADGSKTVSTLLNELYLLIDSSKVTYRCFMAIISTSGTAAIYHASIVYPGTHYHLTISTGTSGSDNTTAILKSGASTRYTSIGTTVSEDGGNVLSNGTIFRFYYK